jgi:excisionase family DNA binding protein
MNGSQESGKRLNTIEEAADKLGISPHTIRKHAAQGSIKTIKLGTRRLVHADEIERVAASGLPSLSIGGK